MDGGLPMKITNLLNARQTLLRQTNLANLAFAYQTLQKFAELIDRGGLRGLVNIKTPDPEAGRYWPALTSLVLNQSVIEEHFTEEDLTDFSDAIAYATGREHFDLSFEIENFSEHFLTPLRLALEQAGIELDEIPQAVEEPGANA
jgi:hypothetical protein